MNQQPLVFPLAARLQFVFHGRYIIQFYGHVLMDFLAGYM